MFGLEYLIVLAVGILLGCFYSIANNKKTCDENDMATVTLIHEIRNQITGLKWVFNLLSDKKLGSSTEEGDIKLLQEGNKKISNTLEIVNDTFNIIKFGDKATFKPENNNLVTITENCVEEYRVQAQERNVQIKTKTEGDLSNIIFDRLKMTQILRNIIGNAVKYSNTDGTVQIELEKLNNLVKIAVSDNGIGVPKDEQPKLFTRFFRARNAENISGSGLGLYIANNLIARHGGKIEVESIEGEGSKFTIIFPIK